MSEVKQEGVGFTAPPSVNSGNAEFPKNGGVVTKKSATKLAVDPEAKKVRNIKVVAKENAWFDCKRIKPGTKLTVSEQEFSEKWMEKI